MAEKTSSLEAKMRCSICLGPFRTPKLLPCYHTYCAECIESYMKRTAQNSKFHCPACNRNIDVPEKGADAFQNNFYVQTTMADVKDRARVSCDACGTEKEADHMCVDCEENFCSQCTRSHMNMKMSRDHKLLDLKKVTDKKKVKFKSRVFCDKHPDQEILVVCTECDRLLCVLCTVTEHKYHETTEIAGQAEKIRNKLEVRLKDESLNGLLEKLRRNVNVRKARTDELNRSLNTEMKRVQEQGRKLHTAVDDATGEAKRKLKENYQRMITENTEKVKELESLLESRTAIKQMTQSLLDRENEAGIVQKGPAVCDQLENVLRDRANVTVYEDFQKHGLFSSGDISASSLRNMVGAVKRSTAKHEKDCGPNVPTMRVPLGVTPLKKRIKFKSTFTFAKIYSKVVSIVPVSDNRVWICGNPYPHGELYLVNMAGQELRHHRVDTWCHSVATDDDENLIVSCPTDKSIRRVTVTGREETLLSGIEDKPLHAIVRNADLSASGVSELIFSCESGMVYKSMYGKGLEKSVLASGFKNPVRLACDPSNGNICVSDFDTKRVHILDNAGNVLGCYEDARGQFQPFGVGYDHRGCCLVTNEPKNEIRRLKEDGTLVETLLQNDCRGCRSVVLDKNNNLWLGGLTGQVRVYKLV